jgi:2-polyprenyl-3-methyl-5-hydroxy-6-metoxy-1,4-benzoquinol methylase
VLDYGCGEGSVLSFLIPPSATDDIHFTHLMGIDIDQRLLEEATLAACRPWVSDYEQLREAPLTVDIYAGSVDQFDDRFMMTGCDDAIICSEVIEHVYPDTLNACLPLMLGVYAPSLVIVTTPNAEYNTFFPDLHYGAPGATFRHDDHKFEWTRQQFEEW